MIAKRRLMKPDEAPRDLLGLMLNAKDPLTGERLDDENIRNQLVTFLIAGHETTSGLLSFATYLLLRTPRSGVAPSDEVDEVLGADTPRFEQIGAARLHRPAPARDPAALPDGAGFRASRRSRTRCLAGRYPSRPADDVPCPAALAAPRPGGVGRSRAFRSRSLSPERRGAFPNMPGCPLATARARASAVPFAHAGALLVLAMMLQRFDIWSRRGPTIRDQRDAHAQARTAQDSRPRAPARDQAGRAPRRRQHQLAISSPHGSQATPTHGTPLLLLYGSNSGASEAFARRIASDGAARGYASRWRHLTTTRVRCPKRAPTAIVTASYNGQPPDNAREILLLAARHGRPERCRECNYAIFGCGNRRLGRDLPARAQSSSTSSSARQAPSRLLRPRRSRRARRLLRRLRALVRAVLGHSCPRARRGGRTAPERARGPALRARGGALAHRASPSRTSLRSRRWSRIASWSI